MKEVTLIVPDGVAEALERLVLTGRLAHCKGRRGRDNYTAFTLAGMTRPVNGDRWLKLPKFMGWARLPERLSFGG